MDTFHDEDILLMQLHHVALEVFTSFLEIEAWNFHFLSFQKVVQLTSEEIQIHCSQSLKIIFAILITRCKLPLHKVIIEFYHLRIQSQDAALQGQTL